MYYLGMKTLIKSQSKIKISSFDQSTYQNGEKPINSRISSGSKFYQKLFIIFLTLSTFLIFPESPKDSDILCKKYYTDEACTIW